MDSNRPYLRLIKKVESDPIADFTTDRIRRKRFVSAVSLIVVAIVISALVALSMFGYK